MTQDEMLKIAKECGFDFADRYGPMVVLCSTDELQAFAKALQGYGYDPVGSMEAIVDDEVLKHLSKSFPVTTMLYRRKD